MCIFKRKKQESVVSQLNRRRIELDRRLDSYVKGWAPYYLEIAENRDEEVRALIINRDAETQEALRNAQKMIKALSCSRGDAARLDKIEGHLATIDQYYGEMASSAIINDEAKAIYCCIKSWYDKD